MKHLLERVVLLAISQELDSLALQPPATTHPADYVTKAIERVRPRLSEMGIPQDKMAQVISEADVTHVFVPGLVPNPAYWRQHLHRQLRFYLVHNRASRYRDLLDYLRGMPSMSYATCYGDMDFIIRLNATDEHSQHFDAALDRLGVTSTILPVAAVPYYLGHEERNTQRADIPAEEIDNSLASRADDVSGEEIKRLISSGVVLGVVVREDHLATGRIRAYVSISLRENLDAPARATLERKLIGFNASAPAGHAMPIVSLYRLNGRPHYFLELICDDQAQLDSVTDTLQSLDRAIENTDTMIVARYLSTPELCAQPRIDADERTQQLKEVVDKVLAPISDQLLAHVSDTYARQFASLEPHMQLRVLNLYQELTADSPYLKKNAANPLQPAVIDLVTGVIEQNTSRITNAGMTAIRDHVERQHTAVVSQITEDIFNGDDQKWQSEFKLADAGWRKWGLRVWGERVYPAWNAHPLLQHLFTVEPDVLDSLRIVGDARNSFAHYRETDPAHVTRVAREVFNHSYKILAWLESVSLILANPVVPFQAVASTIAAGRHGRELELLNSFKSLRVDLHRLQAATAVHTDQQLRAIVGELQALAIGVRDIDATLIESISSKVLPLLSSSQRGGAVAVLEALKGSIGTIPAGVASSLLAAILAAALKFGQ